MKKRIFGLILLLLMLTAVSFGATAEGTTPTANNNVSIEFALNNPSYINSMTSEDAGFKIVFNGLTAAKTYKIEYSVDGTEKKSVEVTVSPYDGTEAVIPLDVKNGERKLEVTVYEGGKVVKTFSEKLAILTPYERKWGDVFSVRSVQFADSDHYQNNKQEMLNKLKASGYMNVRSGFIWSQIEDQRKGYYNFSKLDSMLDDLASIDIDRLHTLNQGNGFFYPARPTGVNSFGSDNTSLVWWLPQTTQSLDGWANFVVASANHPRVSDYMEVWNEPNIMGTDRIAEETTEYSQVYADIVTVAKTKLLAEGNYDVDFAAFATAETNAEKFISDGLMKYGIYPLAKDISHHTYRQRAFRDDQIYENYTDGIEEANIEAGGWMGKIITETGQTTPTQKYYPTEEFASWEMVKVLVHNEAEDHDLISIYSFYDKGTNREYTEDNFGQIRYDLSLKWSYYSVNALNRHTNGGFYTGRLDFGDDIVTEAFVYNVENNPVLVAWTYRKDGSVVKFDFEGETADVYDVYGNLVEKDAKYALLNEAPVYIEGLSEKWFAKAARDEVCVEAEEWLKRYGDLANDEIKQMLVEEITEIANTYDTLPDKATALEHLNAFDAIGKKIIAEGKNGNLEEIEVSRMTYGLYRMMQRLDMVYIASLEDNLAIRESLAYEKAEQKAIDGYLEKLEIKQYTDHIKEQAENYSDNIDELLTLADNKRKGALAEGWSTMEDILCGWFDAFYEYENVEVLGYRIFSPFYERESYTNTKVTTNFYCYNYYSDAFKGKFRIIDSKGEVMFEKDIEIDPDYGMTGVEASFILRRPDGGEAYGYYEAQLIDKNGNVVKSETNSFKVVDLFEFASVASEVPVSEIENLQFRITNLSNEEKTAVIKFTPDENITLKENEVTVVVPAKGEAIVNAPIESIKETAYHFYSTAYEVYDAEGNMILQDTSLLNFTCVVKSDEIVDIANFDGDISDWSDAYPIYMNQPLAPQDPTSVDAWSGADYSLRLFAKWNENGLYILADVYDERQLQENTGSNMWQGDCIQIGIDPLGDGSIVTDQPRYRADDYEIGVSLTAQGYEYYMWQAPSGAGGGIADWFTLIRNDQKMVTRYLIKFDASLIAGLKLAENENVKLNFVLNDADILGRDSWTQFTKGIADLKNPSAWATFVLRDVEQTEAVPSKGDAIFPQILEAAKEAGSDGFKDIKGHWARNTIEEMQRAGIVSGYSKSVFAPDAMITRAEFISMLNKITGVPAATGSYYGDVYAGDWYANPINALAESGLIPSEMVSGGNVLPNQAITREEAIYLAANAAYQAKTKSVPWYKWDADKTVESFADGASVSTWCKPMIETALSEGMVAGSTDGNFHPKSNLTRAESATILYNTLTYFK